MRRIPSVQVFAAVCTKNTTLTAPRQRLAGDGRGSSTIDNLGMKALILWDFVTIAGDGWMQSCKGPNPQSDRLRVVHPTHGQSQLAVPAL